MDPQTVDQVSSSTIQTCWWITLGLGLVVTIVVAILLSILTRTAEQIDAGAAEIWRVGKLIANNTVHIPLLVRTNQIAAGIVAAAGGIAGATGRIERTITRGAADQVG